jgi:hypothetical protein
MSVEGLRQELLRLSDIPERHSSADVVRLSYAAATGLPV